MEDFVGAKFYCLHALADGVRMYQKSSGIQTARFTDWGAYSSLPDPVARFMGKGKKRERVRRKKKGREGSDVKGKGRNKERRIRKKGRENRKDTRERREERKIAPILIYKSRR